ncbi:MAG: MoaD/ThiS family protein [Verrucomicrobiales bacterium]|nr:MoaD/ThiS family protein [Verrucomicrobiales bacterium]
MKIAVQYFALLREERGCAGEEIDTAVRSPSELFLELRARHGFSLTESSLRVAINDEFGEWNASLCDRDVVSFLPPVAGG